MILEFTLAGIPMIFLWISLVQLSIGMWRFHTIQYAVKQAGSYITVHGASCWIGANTCKIKIRDAAQVLRNSATGIPPELITVTFRAFQPDHTTEYGAPITCTLDNCLNDATDWPPAGYRDPGYDVEITAHYRFRGAMPMLIPGWGSANASGTYNLPAHTRQMILF